jgi:hypothetical protein
MGMTHNTMKRWTMNRNLVFALVIVFVVATANGVGGAGHAAADSTRASLDQMIDIDLHDATLLLALNTLAVDHRVPIGFEQAMDSRDNLNRHIRLQSGTLKTVLDSLVAQEPRYSWELRNGTINITPVVGRDQFLERFLDTKVSHFEPPTGTTDKFKLRDAVLALPEVRKLLEANGVTVKPYDYLNYRSIYSDDVNLAMTNTDVREVLNNIARRTEHKIWSLERLGEKRELPLTY